MPTAFKTTCSLTYYVGVIQVAIFLPCFPSQQAQSLVTTVLLNRLDYWYLTHRIINTSSKQKYQKWD
jgi:hypothetical protein